MNLVETTYKLTPLGRKLFHELLCDAADDFMERPRGLCEAFDQYVEHYMGRPEYSHGDPIEAFRGFLSNVIEQVFRPPHVGGYYWEEPTLYEEASLQEMYDTIAGNEQRMLALGFLMAMNEAGDL